MPSAPPSKASLLALGSLLFATYFLAFGVLDDGMILGNDALGYAQHLANGDGGESLWNPHHLLFHPLAALIAACLAPLESASSTLRTPMALAMTAQTVLSALGASLCVLAFLRTALAFNVRSRLVPYLLALLLAFSSCFWLYGAVGETYLPAVAAEAALLGLVLRIALRPEQNQEAPTNKENQALIALLLLATLLRQDSVLVVVPVILLLPLRRALFVSVTAGALCLVFYFLAFQLAGSEMAFAQWMRGLADSGLWGGTPTWSSLLVAVGMLASSLTYPLWFVGNSVQSGSFSLAVMGGQLTLGLLPWLAILAALVLSRRTPSASTDEDARAKKAAVGLLIFIAIRFSFFTWWQPINMEYYCGTLLPLFFLAALALRKASTTPRLSTGLLVTALLALVFGNWSVLIAPNQGTDMDLRAREVLTSAGPKGLALGLDRLGFYSLMRAQQTAGKPQASLPAILDISDAASGVVPTAVATARAQIRTTLANGGKVFALRDMILPARFQHAPWHLDWTDENHTGGMSQVLADIEATPMDPQAGLASWLWRLR